VGSRKRHSLTKQFEEEIKRLQAEVSGCMTKLTGQLEASKQLETKNAGEIRRLKETVSACKTKLTGRSRTTRGRTTIIGPSSSVSRQK